MTYIDDLNASGFVMGSRRRVALGAAAAAGLVLLWLVAGTDFASTLQDEDRLHAWVESAGPLGPVLLIGLMALAIVASPIPSGPIAMVAGAAYGKALGTLYVVLGAEAGALIAFSIARVFGYRAAREWSWARRLLDRSHSQSALMTIVFLSRLVPFISYDAVSYVAGLTPLGFWRFALATLAGVAPISFVFAYLGEGMFSAGSDYLWHFVLALGAFTAIPVVVTLLADRIRKRRRAANS